MGQPQDEFKATVDRETTDEAERRDSHLLLDALSSRRDQLGGISQIPAKDDKLSEQILGAARSRSAEIRASRQSTGHANPTAERPIPWWLWLAWIAAIAAVVAAFRLLS